MEATGLAASLATLANTIRIVYSVAHDISDAVNEAEHLREVLENVGRLSSLLDCISREAVTIEHILSPEVLSPTLQTVEHTENELGDLATRMRALSSGSGMRLRLKAVFGSKSQAQDLKLRLIHTHAALNALLSVSGMLTQFNGLRMLEGLSRQLEVLTSKTFPTPLVEPQGTRTASAAEVMHPQPTVYAQTQETFQRWTYGMGECQLRGSFGAVLTRRTAGKRTTNAGSVLLKLPWSKLLAIHVLWKQHTNAWLAFNLVGGSSLSVVNIISEDCAFMKACRIGDTLTMNDMLYSGRARPNDVTPDNSTALCLAIESGKAEAVKTLIQHGADVDALFGSRQTSPLAWAVCQRHLEIIWLLMSNGASFDHVSSYGWSPLFYLWSRTAFVGQSAVDFVEALAKRGNFDFHMLHGGVSDIEGFGVIHRAVIFGTADEVALLLRLGVNPYQEVGPLLWTAIHNAAFYGRDATFDVLLPYYQRGNFHIDTRDPRGWTLLHIAASAGHGSITRRLLRLGASPKALSSPSYTHMPEVLHGGRWTPAEVAKVQSKDRWLDFLAATKEVKGEVFLTQEELDALGEEEWFDVAELPENELATA
ncbi:uncharacterized protein HMPREF1541_11029 [Cyphellophora europaea CBS 101466]|uniref:Uncharacterized protein n=1 Tax=Cyphellophora europaea (strain CBS 101466) TaxID=1220924 RepID=W2S796_CYPE1|nr:uncharacterized protein HMPREF1541_11029 [Cyphellophora europaea CBS 101466]ETN43898.1 hypothetical protein HMPREF1541_11029 [Cyphellophora europaea CBS 101466]